MTKERLAARFRSVGVDEDGRSVGLVSFADALAYGDTRYEEGLRGWSPETPTANGLPSAQAVDELRTALANVSRTWTKG